MSQPRPVLKAAALGSSILLVWGLVAHQANAFNWLLEMGLLDALTHITGEDDQTIMSGTKSSTRLIDPPPPAKTHSETTIMSSPNSGAIAVNQPNPLLKFTALASSILLVSGLVGYRANAFHWRAGTTPPTAGSSRHLTFFPGTSIRSTDANGELNFDNDLFDGTPTESPYDGAAVEYSTAGTYDPNLTIMSGSKSAAVFIPRAPATTESGSTFLYSSKGGPVFTPPTPARSELDATIMSSSKSIILTPPPAQAAANGPARDTSQAASRSR